MMLSPYSASWYSASMHPAPQRASLAGTVECDVCVVGGGIAGCSTALHLAERGYRVVLLEEHRIGWGASGRSGAQVLPGVAAGQEKLERLVGPDDARRIWDITVEGMALVKELIGRYDIACDWAAGHMLVALKPRHEAQLCHELRLLQERYQYTSIRYMPRDEVRATLATDRYIAALYDANSGHMHPLNYTLGLAAAAERAGAQVFEHTRALRYREGNSVRVHTTQGDVICRQLALCGNAYLGSIAPALNSKILGVATYVIATQALGAQRAANLIANNAAVADMNWVLDYFRLTPDHRLLFGGRVSYAGLESLRTAAATRHRMLKVFPQLADARVEYAWGGFIDISVNRAPHFGRLRPNVYFLQGFSGHGIALTGIAGKLLAQAIAGTAERFDVFARIPHRDFPGGRLLRRPALVLAMLYFRLKDLL